MKNSLILSLFLSLAIVSTERVQAVNWDAAIHGVLMGASGSATFIAIQLMQYKPKNLLDAIDAVYIRNMGVAISIPCGILTLVCAKNLYDSLNTKK